MRKLGSVIALALVAITNMPAAWAQAIEAQAQVTTAQTQRDIRPKPFPVQMLVETVKGTDIDSILRSRHLSAYTPAKPLFKVEGDSDWFIVSKPNDTYFHLYSAFKKMIAESNRRRDRKVLWVEPDGIVIPKRLENAFQGFYKDKEDGAQDYYDIAWTIPKESANGLWFKSPDFSQLGDALQRVTKSVDESDDKIWKVRVAHLDRGYDPASAFYQRETIHPKFDFEVPELTDANSSWFAVDRNEAGTPVGPKRHGVGTLGVLAGKDIGCIPQAPIEEMKISHSVILLNASPFCQAVDKAIADKCDVISMSMGGLPSRAWAAAVDRAYNHGITICAAAGDCGLTLGRNHDMVWPARFSKVIAVTGITCDGQPYYKYPKFNSLQGSFGPPSEMRHAIAGWTPNIVWPKHGQPPDLNGPGTSAATPQVAAAAALWLQYHVYNPKSPDFQDFEQARSDPNFAWQKVEAVRTALFAAANNTDYPKPKPEIDVCEEDRHNSSSRQRMLDKAREPWNKGDGYFFFGNGALKADDALSIKVEPKSLKRNIETSYEEVQLTEFFDYLSSLFSPMVHPAEELPHGVQNLLAQEIYQMMVSKHDRRVAPHELAAHKHFDHALAQHSMRKACKMLSLEGQEVLLTSGQNRTVTVNIDHAPTPSHIHVAANETYEISAGENWSKNLQASNGNAAQPIGVVQRVPGVASYKSAAGHMQLVAYLVSRGPDGKLSWKYYRCQPCAASTRVTFSEDGELSFFFHDGPDHNWFSNKAQVVVRKV